MIAQLVDLIRSKASSVISEEDLSSILGESSSSIDSNKGSLNHNGSMGVGLDLDLLDPEESNWIDNNLRADPLGIAVGTNPLDLHPSNRSSSKQGITEEENGSNIFL